MAKVSSLFKNIVTFTLATFLMAGHFQPASALPTADFTLDACDVQYRGGSLGSEYFNVSWDSVSTRPIIDIIVPSIANGKCVTWYGSSDFLQYFELISSPGSAAWPLGEALNYSGSYPDAGSDPAWTSIPVGTYRFQLKSDATSTEETFAHSTVAFDADFGGTYGVKWYFNIEVTLPVPGQPGQPIVVANADSFTVTWTAPTVDAEWVDGYIVKASPNGGSQRSACSTNAATLSCEVTALQNGSIALNPAVSYVFYVAAFNSNEDAGPQSVGSSASYLINSDSSITALTFKESPSGSSLSFTPSFDADVFIYAATIAFDRSSVALSATPAAGGSITYSDNTTATINYDGSYYLVSNLPYGATVVSFEVTAEDDVTTSTYSFTITRESPPYSDDASLSAMDLTDRFNRDLRFTPEFNASTYTYTALLDASVNEANILAVSELNANIELSVNNSAIVNSTVDGWRISELPVGLTIVTLTVTAEDGETILSYVINITRAARVPVDNGDTDPVDPDNPLDLNPIDNGDNSYIPADGFPQGEFVFLVNGQPVEIVISPNQSSNGTSLVVTGPSLTMELEGRDENKVATEVNENQSLVLISRVDRSTAFSYGATALSTPRPTVYTSGTGFKPNSIVKLFILPGIEIGELETNSAGVFEGELDMPDNLKAGEYTLQVNGFSPTGEVRSLSLGVLVTNLVDSTSLSKKIIFEAGSAKLTSKAKEAIKQLILKTGLELITVTSKGYVQNDGDLSNSQKLSLARAKTVVKYLKKLGVTGTYKVKGVGPAGNSPSARKVIISITY